MAQVVRLTWEVPIRNSEPVLLFRWEKKGGPRVEKPATTGFGSYLMEHGVPGASVKRDFAADGMTCTIEVPLTGNGGGGTGVRAAEA